MNGHQRRLTLLPFGRTWPDDATCSLEVLLEACGGDRNNCVEGSPKMPLEVFMHMCADRIASYEGERLIIALGKEGLSLRDLLDIREMHETRFPQLTKAIWVILVANPLDVMFVRSLNEMGEFSSPELDSVPVWTSTREKHDPFLIFVPKTKSLSVVPIRIKHMRTQAYKTSRPFRVPSTSSSTAVAALTSEQIAAAAEFDKPSSRS